MTQLYLSKQIMPGAAMGPENPLPDFGDVRRGEGRLQLDDSVSPEERRYMDYGNIRCILPYRLQDGYSREKSLQEYPCMVLENDHLKATFFPQFGGKMWSLYDKDQQRDLLQSNPVFQPCNLALRDAWTSGGTEWNIGMRGHTPFTLSQLHTARGTLPDGTPVLRMYEWERIRRVLYQLDFILPENSRFLYLRAKVINTAEQEVPMYWWSNTAVVETPQTRVLVPADSAFTNTYTEGVAKTTIPISEGVDTTYSLQLSRARDFFYDIPQERRKWECAVNGDGRGLIQTSTDLLQGRKMFVWGNSPGGAHWQEFLSVPGGEGYIEIQAGIAKTQFECIPMPGSACWEWLEAYGPIQTDPTLAHGDWEGATAHAEAVLEGMLPRAEMDALLARYGQELDQVFPVETSGSGWAALELERMGLTDHFPGSRAVMGAASLTEEQAPWQQLLRTGAFPNWDPMEEPAAYLTQEDWIPLLEQAAETTSDHWHSWFHLGVMYYANRQDQKAEAAFLRSLACRENGWALRCLAQLSILKKDGGAALGYMRRAAECNPVNPLMIEFGRMLLDEGEHQEYLDRYSALPAHQQAIGRLTALKAEALVHLDRLEEAKEILLQDVDVANIRECEILLSDI